MVDTKKRNGLSCKNLNLLKVKEAKKLFERNESLKSYLKYHYHFKVQNYLVEKKTITISKLHYCHENYSESLIIILLFESLIIILLFLN